MDATGATAQSTEAPSPPAADGEGDPTLVSLLGIGGTPEEVAQRVRSAEHTRQELIRRCMTGHGFQYIPHTTAGEMVNTTGLPASLPAEEFRRQYGYGIATGFENALTLKPDDPEPDPNLAITGAMSPAERTAYERAMYGDGGEGGCQAEATEATDRHSAIIEEFGDDLADINARVNADARVVEAERTWQDCLAAAGHHYPDETAIQLEIQRRMNPVYTSVMGEPVPEGTGIIIRDRQLTAEQSALLSQVRSFELGLANVDQDCRDQTGLDQIRRDVRDEYDARFVAENLDRIREMVPDAGL